MSSGNSGEPRDVSLWGIADMELLAIVDDLADDEGWTNTYSVRLQLGEDVELTGHRSGVGSRLAWMRRYGWLEGTGGQWRLTADGHTILDGGKLTRALTNQLDKLNPAQRVRLTREIAQAGGLGPDPIRTALRREWVRSLGRR